MASGEIQASLFAATDAAGLPDAIAVQIGEIFGSEIDFHRDLRKGDRFTVVYEMVHVRGEPLRAGRVLAAEFINDGKAHRAVWFQGPDGHSGGYYAPDGKNLRKAFLRSPLEFSRISSGFSGARYHPVLKEWRAHRGIDYAAATGTKVRATADGVVEYIGRQNGYGNLIVLQHSGRHSTAYGHLNGFASGLRRGSRVSQGDVIGFVGSTGLATGPHLHYEFRVDGQQRNPMSVAMPAAEPVPAHLRTAFEAAAGSLSSRLEQIAGLNLARLD
jgi:murein DD-endopeptidase MepM/ murein hydrolase activator NlpD